MKNHIAEELPVRKHAPAAAPNAKGDEKGGKDAKSPEAKVRQAVYDIRYRARREEVTLQQAYSQYMQNSNMSQQEKTLVKQKLFGKGGMQAEDFQIEDFAYDNVANALYKVFVEGVEKDEPIVLTYMEKLETAEDRKYKVRVTGKDGRSYVRYATREKISSLRANPNIQSVEMTEYGEPYEGEKKRGEETARAKSGKDYDGDGKVESGAKEYRGAVHNAIQRKKGGVADGKDTSNVKEEFIDEVKKEKKDNKKDKPTDTMKGCNNVVIGPDVPGSSKDGRNLALQMNHYGVDGPFIVETATSESHLRFIGLLNEKSVSQNQQQLAGMALAYLRGEMPDASEEVKKMSKMGEKKLRDFAKTKHKGLPVHKEETECEKKDNSKDDMRAIPTEVNLAKNKLRAMGLKMSYEPEGDLVDEGTKESQESRFQKYGDRSEPETHSRLIGTAARASDSLRARRKRMKPESPKGQELERRDKRMGERITRLQAARQKDTSEFRQGPTDKSMERKG